MTDVPNQLFDCLSTSPECSSMLRSYLLGRDRSAAKLRPSAQVGLLYVPTTGRKFGEFVWVRLGVQAVKAGNPFTASLAPPSAAHVSALPDTNTVC